MEFYLLQFCLAQVEDGTMDATCAPFQNILLTYICRTYKVDSEKTFSCFWLIT